VFDIAVMKADGSGKQVLAPKDRPDTEEWDSAARWSPDGTLVAFVRYIGLENTDVYLVRADGRGLRNLTATNGANEGSPAWAPDGQTIAFARSSAADPRESGIWLVRPDGSGLRQLTSDEDSEPTWSPDGQALAFDRHRVGVEFAIFTIRVDGDGLRRLTGFGNFSVDQWSTDRESLLYERSSDSSIWTIRADGTGNRKLVDGYGAAWSPDGKQLVFDRSRSTRRNIQYLTLVADAAGRHARVVFHGVALNQRAIWSRDSRVLALAARHQCNGVGVYVVRVTNARARRISNDCRVIGTRREDRLLGTRERDLIWGLGGDDYIDVSPGNPKVLFKPRLDHNVAYGGAGNDRIVGRRGEDVLIGGSGRDYMSGGGQSDFVRSRDRERDVVVCGPGTADRVIADGLDRVAADCERVLR
jgi:Tol biopolymer transport system component